MSFIKVNQDKVSYAQLKDRISDCNAASKLELKEIEKSFTRIFSSDDGRRVLGYLQAITFHRALSPETAEAELRYVEGQRAMMATILRLIDRGRNN